jgi:hypothetical protein
VSLTTTQAGSLIYGVGNDWDRAAARTPGSGQTIVHQFLASGGDTFWSQNQVNASSGSNVQVVLNDTAPTVDRWNFASVEIVPVVQTGFQVIVAYNGASVGWPLRFGHLQPLAFTIWEFHRSGRLIRRGCRPACPAASRRLGAASPRSVRAYRHHGYDGTAGGVPAEGDLREWCTERLENANARRTADPDFWSASSRTA